MPPVQYVPLGRMVYGKQFAAGNFKRKVAFVLLIFFTIVTLVYALKPGVPVLPRFIRRMFASKPKPTTTIAPKVETTTTPEAQTINETEKPPPPYVMPTYYMNAYLVSAKGGTPNLRLPAIRQCTNPLKTRVQLGPFNGILTEGNRHSQCSVGHFPKFCRVKAALEWVHVTDEDIPRPLPDHVNLTDADGKVFRVPLVDSREGGAEKRTHALGACLKTMFGFTDWRRLITYMEFWISQGTTIFVFYIHTISHEVDSILRIYERDQNIEIHRVGWGDVPTELPEDHPDNPNNNMWMTAEETQRNDCLLRFRSRAKYVTTLDTDEVIGLGYPNQTTLIQLMDRYINGNVNIAGTPGALIFLHTMASTKPLTMRHPTEVTFQEYRSIALENVVYKPWDRSKPIYVPDNVYDGGIHLGRGFEEAKYSNAVVPADEARLIHMRAMRPFEFLSGKAEGKWGGKYTSILEVEAKKWFRAWRKRIRRLTFKTGLNWNPDETAMLKATLKCQQKGFAKEYCPSVSKCLKPATKLFHSTWVRHESAYITIKN